MQHLPSGVEPDITRHRLWVHWKGTEALQRCYLHADDATMLAVVMSGAELREVRKA